MKTCPTCGKKVRPDLTECPDDGTALVVGAPTGDQSRLAPPPGPPPPSRTQPSAPATPAAWSNDGLSGSLTEKSTASSWIFALLACGLIAGGYFVARDHLLPPSEEQPSTQTDDATPKKKKRKRKKRKRAQKPGSVASAEENYDDYDWEDDLDDNGIEIGDVFEREDPNDYVEAEPAKPPPPYEPKRDEYQPSGSYRPTASWSEPGASADVTVLDLGSSKSNAPLDESQVRSVLNVGKLAPCYDPWVQKIPQMQGRVHVSFIVAEDGHVASVKLTSSALRSRVVESCIVKRARGFRFPRSEGGKTKFQTHFDFTNR